jgi:hypothetical protein
MKHTYLLFPGTWHAKGAFRDNNGNSYPVTGSSIITHERRIWYNRSAMLIHTTPLTDIECLYEITPIEPGECATTWTAETLPMGRISGNFAIVDNTILSSAYTPQGANIETLRQLDENTYENRGALFMDGQLLSAWDVILTKAD